MTATKNDTLIARVALYNTLLENCEAFDATDEDERFLEEFLREYPGIVNYDSRGNWIGSVANENGWTA
jgi:hypothetical protein